jgi:2-oxoglutarate dehydrogenase E1 component
VVPPIEGGGTRELPLSQLLAGLQATYCGKCGYEFAHITRRDRREWLRGRIEEPLAQALTAGAEDVAGAVRAARRLPPADRKHLLDRLAWSSNFESFLENKYGAAKRFGLEGAENLVPGMKAMIDRAAELGVESIILGMPHRGRLNVLANVLIKPL